MKCCGNDLARRGFLSVGVVGGLGLFLGLTQATLVFGGVNACQHLTHLHAVAFAHGKFFDFTRYSRFDGREVALGD